MEERQKAEETAAVPAEVPQYQPTTSSSSTRQPAQGKRQGHPVTLKEFLLDDVPISIKRARGQTGPVRQLADTPLLVEAFVAER
eukprot:8632721-Pyramimonas_sp.AAC.1